MGGGRVDVDVVDVEVIEGREAGWRCGFALGRAALVTFAVGLVAVAGAMVAARAGAASTEGVVVATVAVLDGAEIDGAGGAVAVAVAAAGSVVASTGSGTALATASSLRIATTVANRAATTPNSTIAIAAW